MDWSLLHDRRADEPPPLLHDRYAVESPIGQGRATVYRGTDTRLGRTVALKRVVLASGQESGERVHLRALREARAAARLDHPSVVTVYDVVEEDDALWLVMELVDAPSLAQLVTEDGVLDHARVARIGRDVLGALAAAHREGVVHRDVKPANVLVPPTGPAKLADFGVATLRDETRVTATGLVVGSPAYMSPEQAKGEDVGPAADLWALAATLYFAYEGEPPFDGGTALATASAVVHGEPRPEQRPGLLSPLVARLLDKAPASRPATGDVRRELRTIAGSADDADADEVDEQADVVDDEVATVPAAPVGSAVALPAELPTERTRFRSSPTAPRRGGAGSRLAWLIVVVAMIVAALVVLAFDPDDLLPDDETGAQRDGAGQEQEEGERAATTTATTAEPDATTPATTEPSESGSGSGPDEGATEVPEGWRTYTDPTAGYTVAHPAGWQVEPADGPRIDFRDPETGSYLRVDWTDQPQPDPVADWRTQAERFAANHEGYEEIAIAPAEYRDYTAAGWEFRYTDGGARLHALNLGFIVGDKAYALFFQTKDELWSSSQDVLAQMRASFQPAGG
jgi:eukaryotic-like serine/threonine-protein kinase